MVDRRLNRLGLVQNEASNRLPSAEIRGCIQLNSIDFVGGDSFAGKRKTFPMDEPFDLPVMYKGEERLFPSYLQQLGFTHRIVVHVFGTEVAFEPDEERNYRALVDPEEMNKEITADLLKAIAETIEQIVK